MVNINKIMLKVKTIPEVVNLRHVFNKIVYADIILEDKN